MDRDREKIQHLHNDLLYITIAVDYLHHSSRNKTVKKDIDKFKAKCKSHLGTPYWDSDSNVSEIIDQLERRGLVRIGDYIILKDIVDFDKKIVREINNTELALQSLGIDIRRAANDDGIDRELAMSIRMKMDEVSTGSHLDDELTRIIRTSRKTIYDKIMEAFGSENFDELNKRWRLHDARVEETVEYIRYFHEGDSEKFQHGLHKCVTQSEEKLCSMNQDFYMVVGQWREVNESLLRQTRIEETLKGHGATLLRARKGSLFLFVRFAKTEDLDKFQHYYENKHLERDFENLILKGKTNIKAKLIVKISDENFGRHRMFLRSLVPEYLIRDTKMRLSKAESSPSAYETQSIRNVVKSLQTHSCVILSSDPNRNMTTFSHHILSRFTRDDKKMLPIFITSFSQIWKIIENTSEFFVLSCKPSKFDLHNDDVLSSFFVKLEQSFKRGTNKFKMILIIDSRCIQHVIRHFIRYDISSETQVIDITSDNTSLEDVHGVAESLCKRYNTVLSKDRIEALLKFGTTGIYSAMESVLKQNDAKIEKLFHDRSDEAIIITILFLRDGQYSNESDCEQINTAVYNHFRRDKDIAAETTLYLRDGQYSNESDREQINTAVVKHSRREKNIAAETLSASITRLLHRKIVRWDDFESKFCFSDAFIAQCVVDNIIQSGFETLLIDTVQLRQLDFVESSRILRNNSSCSSLISKLERELRYASSEYVREILSLKIWESKRFQDALLTKSEESVSFYNTLQSLDNYPLDKLIESFVSHGNIFLVKYFIKEIEVNDTSLLAYFSAGVKSDCVKMCEYLLEYFRHKFCLDLNTIKPLVLIAVEVKSLQMLQFCRKLIPTFDKSALFLAVKLGSIPIAEYLIENGVDITSTDEEQQTILHIASNVDDSSVFSFLIRNAPHLINNQDSTGRSPLHNAAQSGFISHVALLLQEKNTNLSLKTIDNECLLHASVRSLSKSMVSYVVEKMSHKMFIEQFQSKDRLGYTPIDLAVYFADKHVVECLISKTVALECTPRDHGLFFPMLVGFMRRVSNFFDFENDVNSLERWYLLSHVYRMYPHYQTFLDEVTELGTFLLETYDNFTPELLNMRNPSGMTSLSLAVCCNAKKIIRNLLEKGADYCCVSEDGSTLLHFCVKYGSSDLINVFPNFPVYYLNAYDKKGFHAGDFLIKQSKEDMDIIFDYLYNQGACLIDENGDSILHRLARCDVITEFGITESSEIDQWISLTNTICKIFPSVCNLINHKGDPPLWELTIHGKRDIVKHFLTVGADIYKVCSNGRSLLHAAVLSKSHPMVNAIIDQAISLIDRPDLKGITPLMLAISMNLNDIVNILIVNHCDLRKTNIECKDAFDIAFEMENMECARKIMHAAPDINRQKPVEKLANAISSNSEEMKILLEFRYGIDSRERNGESILHIAIRQRNIKAIISLLKIPDPVESLIRDDRNMAMTFGGGDSDFVEQPLIRRHPLLNVTTLHENKTPIFISLESGFDNGYRILMTAKADLNVRTNNNQTVIHAAVKGVAQRDLKLDILIELLEECPYLINFPDDFGVPPLFMPESLSSTIIPVLLTYYGADFRHISYKIVNIIHSLSRYGNFQLMDFFLEKDQTLAFEEADDGNTPLHLSVSQCMKKDSFLLRDLCRKNSGYVRQHGIQICMLAIYHRKLDTLTDMFGAVLKESDDSNVLETLITNIKSLKCGDAFEKCVQRAVEHGNMKIIEQILIPGIEDCKDENGNTLLYYAVRSKSCTVVWYLHHRAPHLIHLKNYEGNDVLTTSLMEGNCSCLGTLLRYAKESVLDDIIIRALLYVSSESFHEILEKLKIHLPDEKFKQLRDFPENPPCIEAIKRGYVRKFKSLIYFGGDAFHPRYRHSSLNAIHLSVIDNNLEMVKAVVESLVCSNKRRETKVKELNKKSESGKTPLFMAIEFGSVEIISFLLQQKPHLDVISNDGLSLLFAAITYCPTDLVCRLCKSNLRLINREDHDGKTILDHAILSDDNKIFDKIYLLSKFLNLISIYVFEKFMDAIQHRNITEEELPLLLKKNIPLHLIKNHLGQSILHLCLLYKNKLAMDMILDASTNKIELLNIQNKEGFTVLHHLVSDGNYHEVKRCLISGADPNIPIANSNRDVKTLWFSTYDIELKFPLQIAVNNGDYNISKLLIDFNADTKIIGPNGENLLFQAIALRNTGICELLLDRDRSLAYGFYKKNITPHVFEFLLHGDSNHVVMRRSSLFKQAMLLIKILFFKTMQNLKRKYFLFAILSLFIVFSMYDSSLTFILAIVCFLITHSVCNIAWSLYKLYIFLYLCIYVNFLFLRSEAYVKNQYQTDFFRNYRLSSQFFHQYYTNNTNSVPAWHVIYLHGSTSLLAMLLIQRIYNIVFYLLGTPLLKVFDNCTRYVQQLIDSSKRIIFTSQLRNRPKLTYNRKTKPQNHVKARLPS